MKTADLIGLAIVAAGLAGGAYLYTRNQSSAAGATPPVAYNPPPSVIAVAAPKAAPASAAGNFLADASSTANQVVDLFNTGKSFFGSLFG
jgi:hypothetical protein